MKFVIVLMCVVAVTLADVAVPASLVPLLRHEQTHSDNGYNLEFELGDGTLVREHAVKAFGPEGEEFFRREGSYKYQSPEGEHIEVQYTADENGFRAKGAHLPKSP